MNNKRIIVLVALIVCFAVTNITFADFEMYSINGEIKAVNITDTGIIDGFRYRVINNRYAEIMEYIGTSIDVVIPSEINGYPVECIKDGAFVYAAIESVVIPDSVKSMGIVTFGDCRSLKKITIGKSVTEIDECAFSGCTSLASIEIPDSVTSIGLEAFRGCESLTNVTLGKDVKNIGKSAFAYCTSLKSARVPNATTVIDDYAFLDCESLTSLTIGKNVEKIGERAFYNCNSLEKVQIPNSVTIIETGAFAACDSLTSVTIPKSVENIAKYVFYDCAKLTVYGVSGSYAEEYSKANNIPFVVISENENDFGISEESVYSIDEEKGILQGVLKETSFEKFISNFKNGNLAVTNANGEAITDENALVGTGYTVNLIDENGNVQKSVTVLVMGDLGGDGRMNSRDIATLQRHLVEMKRLEGVYLLASDVKADGTLNSRDIAQLQKNIIG